VIVDEDRQEGVLKARLAGAEALISRRESGDAELSYKKALE
jgi:hypothetical protein